MRFGPVALAEARGALLAHSVEMPGGSIGISPAAPFADRKRPPPPARQQARDKAQPPPDRPTPTGR